VVVKIHYATSAVQKFTSLSEKELKETPAKAAIL